MHPLALAAGLTTIALASFPITGVPSGAFEADAAETRQANQVSLPSLDPLDPVLDPILDPLDPVLDPLPTVPVPLPVGTAPGSEPAAPAPGSDPPPAAPIVPGADSTPPSLTLRTPATQRKRRVLSRGLPLRARCSETCRLTVRLQIDGRTAKRARLARRRRPVTIGRLSATVTPEGRRLTVKLSRRARVALKRLPRVRLALKAVATDAAGNARPTTAKTILRR